MTLLQSDALYYYTQLIPESMSPFEGSGSLTQGLSVERYLPPEEGAKGLIHWFDKIEVRLRSIEIRDVPSLREKTIIVFGVEGSIHSFQYVDVDVYNRLVRKMLPKAPPLSSDGDIQAYLKNLNPYE